MLAQRNGTSLLGTLEEKLFHACSRGDIENVKYYLDQGGNSRVIGQYFSGANMNMICSTGRTPFGTAAQLGNIAILKVFLDHCNDKIKNPSKKEMKHTENTDKSEEKSNLSNFVFAPKGSASSENKVKVDENLNNYQGMYCSCNKVDDVCLGKSCEQCKSFMSALNKTTYDLACFNDTFVRRDPRFKTKNSVNEADLLLDEDVRTPDGMDGLEWDMEVEGNDLTLEGDDPCSALYIWYAGILSQTSSLLEEKPPPKDIDREDQFGRRALHYAVIEGHVDAVRLLISAGCKINVADLGNLTPLHMAAARDVSEVMEMLIAAGANVQHKTTDKISPLHVSASRGLLNNVRLLVEAGAHVDTLDSSDRSPLFMAVSRCHTEVVSYLLGQGAKVNIEEIHGYTPLYEAVSQKNTVIVKMLLRAGAKITQSHHLLHYAILHRHEEMVRLLISAGSIINLRDQSGDTPLILAAKTQQPNIARLLLENGAAINCTNYITGNTALHEAIKNMRGGTDVFEEMFSLFQEFDVNLDVESESGYPALYLAIFLKQDDAAAILIRHGVNVNPVFHNTTHKYSHEIIDFFPWVLQRGNQKLLELFIYAGYNFRNTHIPKNTNDPIERWLLHLQSNPMRLCDLCRIKVRTQFQSKVYVKVAALPVPPAIRTYLKLEDIV